MLLGIANHDGDGGAWPSIATLAKYANIEPRGVKKVLSRLVDLGEIDRDVMGGGTARTPDWARPNRYEILLECPANCDRSKHHRVVDKPGVRTDTGCPTGHPWGVRADTRGVSVRTPEPSKNHSSNSDESSFVSTSPPLICWACGLPHGGTGDYCRSCSNRGMDTPLIECTECGCTRRRQRRGEQHFICRDCTVTTS